MTAIRMDTPELPPGTKSDFDPDALQWSTQDLLLAAAVDEIRVANFLFVQAYKDKNSRAPAPPQPIQRPGVKKPKAKKELTRKQRMSIDPRARQGGH